LRKFRKDRSDIRKQNLRELSQKVKYLIRAKHREYLKKIEGSFKDNPKLFWSYHKAILHHHGKSTSKITHNGKTATTPAGKAELFNSYFSSVFRPPSSQQDIDNTNLLDHPPPEILDRFRSRTRTSKTTWKWRQNGVAYPYMGTTRHFHVVFDVRVLDLNLSIVIRTHCDSWRCYKLSQCSGHHESKWARWNPYSSP
jgi:hypothetical protein